jgi:hypothetical protein
MYEEINKDKQAVELIGLGIRERERERGERGERRKRELNNISRQLKF